MKILGNPILGKIFAGSSLSLKHDGLYRRIIVKRREHNIFLTDDVNKICELLGLELSELDGKADNEVFDIILNSEHFTRDCFFLGRKASQSTSIFEFREYLESVPSNSCPGKPIRTEKVEKVLGIELRDLIDDVKRVFDGPSYTLSGMKLLPYLGDYDKRNFQKHFEVYHSKFANQYEYQKFLKDNSYEVIANFFKKINKI